MSSRGEAPSNKITFAPAEALRPWPVTPEPEVHEPVCRWCFRDWPCPDATAGHMRASDPQAAAAHDGQGEGAEPSPTLTVEDGDALAEHGWLTLLEDQDDVLISIGGRRR